MRSNETAEDITSEIINLVMFVKNEKKTVVVIGLTVKNDKCHNTRKRKNCLLKCKCEEDKMVFVDNSLTQIFKNWMILTIPK